ncbi:MAG: DinB family protein [Phycisphaerales bacterium]|nr:DinB family protein [Phycisphaerales bacterium]
MPQSMPDRFRDWYAYERDCNAKTIAMLESVPANRQSDPNFPRALRKFAHMVAARWNWLHRLGHIADHPTSRDWVPGAGTLEEIRPHLARIEEAWTAYLATIDDAELARKFEWSLPDGRRMRWSVEPTLTQVFGHAWYHRGQIATLVADLGGKPVDTDYIFWSRPEQLA